jgi:hypothetical protein
MRSRDFAGSGGRASGGWVLARHVSDTDESCECCSGHTIRPGAPVHLVEALDGSVLVVCDECAGARRSA